MDHSPPKSDNYKTFGMLRYHHGNEIRQVRSLWEMIYWILYPHLLYETVRIPYFDSLLKRDRVYITDFYDPASFSIIEIKPSKYLHTLSDKAAATRALGYNYTVVDERFFKSIKTPELVTQILLCVINTKSLGTRLKWLKNS